MLTVVIPQGSAVRLGSRTGSAVVDALCVVILLALGACCMALSLIVAAVTKAFGTADAPRVAARSAPMRPLPAAWRGRRAVTFPHGVGF